MGLCCPGSHPVLLQEFESKDRRVLEPSFVSMASLDVMPCRVHTAAGQIGNIQDKSWNTLKLDRGHGKPVDFFLVIYVCLILLLLA